MVQVTDGDIHRHDFARRWGWPLPCVEHFWATWWVYQPSGGLEATSEHIETWNRIKIAELERHAGWPDDREDRLARYRASVDGDFWRIHPAAILFVCSIWIVLVIWVAALRKRIVRSMQNRKLKSGLCVKCGYDLRASPERCDPFWTKSPFSG